MADRGSFNRILKFKVLTGIVEINGTELANNTEIQLSGTKLTCTRQ